MTALEGFRRSVNPSLPDVSAGPAHLIVVLQHLSDDPDLWVVVLDGNHPGAPERGGTSLQFTVLSVYTFPGIIHENTFQQLLFFYISIWLMSLHNYMRLTKH